MLDDDYNTICDNLMKRLTKSEIQKIFSFEYCEYEYHFLGFLENYVDLEYTIPHDFTIVDIGCYLAIQAEYFTKHNLYIGVEPMWNIFSSNMSNYFHKTSNSIYVQDTAKGFVTHFDEYSKKYNLHKNKMFVICSGVPNMLETNLVNKNFPYIRIAYPGEPSIERLP